jgi:drug/metabolite transporter (DMT)-like permease
LPLGWKLAGDAESRAQVGERWIYLGILGLIGVGAYNGLQYVALRTSTPVNVTLIAASLPLWSMIIGTVCCSTACGPTRPQLLGAPCSRWPAC